MKNLASSKFNQLGILLLLFLTCAAFSVAPAQEPVSSPKSAIGCVSGNCANGNGKYIYPSGGVYESDFVNGNMEGRGTYTFKHGDIYIGQFINNIFSGKGKLILSGFGNYEGDFAKGKREGRGVFTFKNGDIYEGTWIDDKREGQGTYTYKNGNQYVGEFSQNKFNGNATYYDKINNTSTRGMWKDDVFVGDGSSVVSASASANKSANQTNPANGIVFSEGDKIAHKLGITINISEEEKAKNKKDAEEMTKELLKPGNLEKTVDALKNVNATPPAQNKMTELYFTKQNISKKFGEFRTAYAKPLSDSQKLEMLNRIKGEYQTALTEAENAEKQNLNFSADQKNQIAEYKTYYTKALGLLSGMMSDKQPIPAKTGEFSQNDVDQFNKQNSSFGAATANIDAEISASPNNDALYYQRGMILFRLKKYDEALADAEKAVQINAKNDKAVFLRGMVKGIKKNYDGAITDFSQVINILPDRASAAYFRRGEMYEQKGDYSKAIADYNKAAEIDPKAVDAATKARLRTEARMNAAQSGTSVGGALTQMKNEAEAKNAELRKLRQYQQSFEALQKEADPFLAKLQATAADDKENQRINRAALLPKVQAVRNYLADSIVELMEYKSPESQNLRQQFMEMFKSVNGLIERLY